MDTTRTVARVETVLEGEDEATETDGKAKEVEAVNPSQLGESESVPVSFSSERSGGPAGEFPPKSLINERFGGAAEAGAESSCAGGSSTVLESALVEGAVMMPQEDSKERKVTSDAPQIQNFERAMRGSGSVVVVYLWDLKMFSNTEHKVYAFDMLDKNGKTHWGHKPSVWQDTAELEKTVPVYKKEENMTISKAINFCRSAPVRRIAGGPNERLSFQTQNKRTIEKHILYGLVSKHCSDEQVVSLVRKFAVTNCAESRLQQAYFAGMKSVTTFQKLLSSTTPSTGDYWEALRMGSQNCEVKHMKHLNEIFMDDTCEGLVSMLFGISRGLSSSMWSPEVRNFAFGNSASG